MRLFIFVSLFLSFSLSHIAYAGFYIKEAKQTVTYSAENHISGIAIDTTNTKKQPEATAERKIPKRYHKESGWRGSASIIIALIAIPMAFLVMPLYSLLFIPSFVLGVKGIRKYRRNMGLAIAGVAISSFMVITLLLYALAIITVL